jgi:hypothetical protein
MFVFWVMTPFRLVGRYQRFGGTYCLHLQGWSSFLLKCWYLPASLHGVTAQKTNIKTDTWYTFYQTTRCYNPEDSNLHDILCFYNVTQCTLIELLISVESCSQQQQTTFCLMSMFALHYLMLHNSFTWYMGIKLVKLLLCQSTTSWWHKEGMEVKN